MAANICTSEGCSSVSEFAATVNQHKFQVGDSAVGQQELEVGDSVQVCDVTKVCAGYSFCDTVDDDGITTTRCPLYDYVSIPPDVCSDQIEPAERDYCVTYANPNAQANCELYDESTPGSCARGVPTSPPPAPPPNMCLSGQEAFCEFYDKWFLETSGALRKCNDDNEDWCFCATVDNPYILTTYFF